MNMTYCRWQNTYNDLRDCAGDLEERMDAAYEERERSAEANREGRDDVRELGPLSTEERSAMLSVLELCATMLEQIGADVDAADAIADLGNI